jgi:hypothetical protein
VYHCLCALVLLVLLLKGKGLQVMTVPCCLCTSARRCLRNARLLGRTLLLLRLLLLLVLLLADRLLLLLCQQLQLLALHLLELCECGSVASLDGGMQIGRQRHHL